MSKHTPGPWVWTNGTDPIDVAIYEAPGYHANAELRAGAELIVGCDEYWIIGPYGEREQMVANAHLIAAAPEMLAELRAILEWAKVERAPLRQQEIDSIAALIIKAEGRP